jgi:putative DNA primase/helicase
MPRSSLDRSVCGSDLANLRASGLTDETIRANRLRTEQGSLVFPYRDLNGVVNCFARCRPQVPRVVDRKEAKYEQPKGSVPRAYFPAASLGRLRDGESPIYVTEGEKKALALAQLGLAAVGIGGVWCWKKKGTDDLIDDLAAVPWAGRPVYVVFDYDRKPDTRLQTAEAARRLAGALRKVGAREVGAVDLPPGPDGSKQGVDDFLVAKGAEPFRELVGQARSISVLSGCHPLTIAKGRTEANNAARLVARHGDVTRWVGPWDKFLLWDGIRWKVDQSLAIDLKAKDVAAHLYAEIAAAIRENMQ